MLFLMYVRPYMNLSFKEASILSWTDNQKLHPFVTSVVKLLESLQLIGLQMAVKCY